MPFRFSGKPKRAQEPKANTKIQRKYRNPSEMHRPMEKTGTQGKKRNSRKKHELKERHELILTQVKDGNLRRRQEHK